MAESIIIHVVTNVISSVISSAINKSADQKFRSLHEIGEKVLILENNLRAIKSWLQHIENKPRRSSWETDRVCMIERVAYDAQEVIDQLSWYQQRLNGTGRSSLQDIMQKCKYLLTLPQIGERIAAINKSIPSINEITDGLRNITSEEGSCTAGQSDTQQSTNSRETIHTEMDDQVIGFDDQINNIRNILICQEHKQLCITSIVGMGGIGKSALAWKIFNDSRVKGCFRMRIWIGISGQEFNVQIESEGVKKMTGGEVRKMLIESLKVERCLIVIDGIWETSSWKEINHDNSTFSNINNGSRIIQTTRKLDVARYPKNVTEKSAHIETHEYEVKLLDDEKSWELLEKKAFQSNAMASEQTKRKLESLRSDFTQKCRGLPLALIALGDYVSSNLTSRTWSRKPDEIEWHKLVKDGINISESLSLSYDDLPSRLKPIFLYITCFSADQTDKKDEYIRVSELVKLWIAEQFIGPSGDCSPEKLARDLVEELHERSLVMVKKRSKAHGWITRIMVHDVLRDWGRARAKKEKFLSVIKCMDHVEDARDFYRVALHGYRVGDLANSMSNLRSLLGFKLPEKKIACAGINSPRIITFNPNGTIYKSPKCIRHMIFLRYICLRKFNGIEFPPEIEQVYRLQTLDCRESKVNSLSDKLWKIPTLRHVYLEICCNWDGPGEDPVRNLRSLYICDGGPSKKIIDRLDPRKYTGLKGISEAVDGMAGIVKLHLISDTGSLPLDILKNISTLSSLEVLELREKYEVRKEMGLTRIPRDYRFPENFVKVKLGCPNMVEDPMPILGKLKELVVLELSNIKIDRMYSSAHSSIYRRMVSSAVSFPKLEYLTIINFSGKKLKAYAGDMPYLCQLKLDGCTKLNTVSGKFQGHEGLTRELTNGTPSHL